MPRMTHADYIAHEERVARTKRKPSKDAAERETGKGGLQQQIMDWCDAQWPRWVYDFPRTDLKSTLPVGRHDSTIWGPFPKVYLIETKAKGGKLSEDQRIWIARLRALKWTVQVLFSLEDFVEITTKWPIINENETH